MAKASVKITTPYPSIEEIDRVFGISKKRAAEIDRLVNQLYASPNTAPRRPSTPSHMAHSRKAHTVRKKK